MLSLQTLVEIAARHLTLIADAMLDACTARAARTGEALIVPPRAEALGSSYGTRSEREGDIDWERMVRSNSDTRRMHQ